MARETSAVDHTDRTLVLLWRHVLGDPQGTRGPKQKTTVDAVVTAAIELADADGIDTFSMRRVADRLGLGAMSVYTYVPGRAELIGLMVDQVAGESPLPPHEGDLRARITAVAMQLWEEYRRHPWLLRVDTTRSWLGPHISDRYEWQLASVDGVGLNDVEMDRVVTMITGFVAGAARSTEDAETVDEESGMDDAGWWEINTPVLQRVMDGSRYPISGRVGAAAGDAYDEESDPPASFAFGLARLIDGIEVFIRAQAA
ncbi:TetR/AcrR family transcriptional regulator [Klugiella xanthotipulae]|uniref:TetR family transcriptional regulator n=1 Tax=Klugiella xanthotipulae TaxID=244735 RepID=A0A543HZ69_9MICO|nr:TetR/AcrR family transcriptional regulator C-terminal domain-containing protein [Klugiella xanthotipulae]TQM63633.1 TetR family transcriptional regulator [Klugiella xanthotipulae]